jgi:hypothetical protein
MGDVLVAVVSTIGVVGAAAIGALGESIRRNARATRVAVGQPDNAEGSVVDMLERLIAGQAGQDRRIARLEERQSDVRHQLYEHALRLTQLEGV